MMMNIGYICMNHLISCGPGGEVDGVGDVPLLGQRQEEVEHQRGLAGAGGAHQQDRDLGADHLSHEVAQARVLVR